MRTALIAEYRKLFSTRMWWVLALVLVGYLGFIGAVMAFSLTTGTEVFGPGMPSPEGAELAESIYSLINPIGYVFPLIIGSLAMTGEFRHQTITQSLLVEPRRSVFLLAKVISTIPVGLAYGILGMAGLIAGAAPFLVLSGDGAYLGSEEIWEVIALGVLVTVVWAMIGVGLGAAIPNQVAAIVVILALTQFVEPLARIALEAFEATSGVAAYLPASAGDAILASNFFGSFYGEGQILSRPAGFAVLIGYAAGLLVLGRLTTLRRDIG